MTKRKLPTKPALDFETTSALIDAAARISNTERAYDQATKHFVLAGGRLPATEEMVDRYIRLFAGTLSVSTLQLRVAAIAHWHRKFGFPDPTKGKIKSTLKGLRVAFNKPPKKALPLAIQNLRAMVAYLDAEQRAGIEAQDERRRLAASRNRAILLLGFWRAFRSDELCRLEAQFITVIPGREMHIFLSKAKNDRDAMGQRFIVPALEDLCPVRAYTHWLEDSHIQEGPIFRSISRWGALGETGLTTASIAPILRSLARGAGLDEKYTSHSLRRGFANWAVDKGWNLNSLMKYVGWKSMPNAQDYLVPKYDFGDLAIQQPASLSSRHWERGSGEVYSAVAQRIEADE